MTKRLTIKKIIQFKTLKKISTHMSIRTSIIFSITNIHYIFLTTLLCNKFIISYCFDFIRKFHSANYINPHWKQSTIYRNIYFPSSCIIIIFIFLIHKNISLIHDSLEVYEIKFRLDYIANFFIADIFIHFDHDSVKCVFTALTKKVNSTFNICRE